MLLELSEAEPKDRRCLADIPMGTKNQVPILKGTPCFSYTLAGTVSHRDWGPSTLCGVPMDYNRPWVTVPAN